MCIWQLEGTKVFVVSLYVCCSRLGDDDDGNKNKSKILLFKKGRLRKVVMVRNKVLQLGNEF